MVQRPLGISSENFFLISSQILSGIRRYRCVASDSQEQVMTGHDDIDRMFEEGFIRSLAKAVASEVAQQRLVAPRLFSLDQAAMYLGMTKAALKYKALDGQIPAVRIDKKWRFDREDLDRIIQGSKQVA
jgi:excisionase family DNA binding protein